MNDGFTNIYQAINAVMQQVGYVQKQRNQNLNFSFAGEAALIAALRPWMVEYGITVFPAGIRDFTMTTFTTAKGTTMNHAVGKYAFHFHHAESDTGFDVEVTGEGMDTSDKAANKALTGAYKYAIRQTFMIETGDDPDASGFVDAAAPHPKAVSPAAPEPSGQTSQYAATAPNKPATTPEPRKAQDTLVKQPAFAFPPTKRFPELSGEEILDFQKQGHRALALSFEDFRALAHEALEVEHLADADLTVAEGWQKIVQYLPTWAEGKARAKVAAERAAVTENVIPMPALGAPRNWVEASEWLHKEGYHLTAGPLLDFAREHELCSEVLPFKWGDVDEWHKLQDCVHEHLEKAA